MRDKAGAKFGDAIVVEFYYRLKELLSPSL